MKKKYEEHHSKYTFLPCQISSDTSPSCTLFALIASNVGKTVDSFEFRVRIGRKQLQK